MAITSLLTVEGLAGITVPGDPTYPAVAALLALLVGGLLVVLGLVFTAVAAFPTPGGRIGDTEIPVSRRHTRELRDLLVRRARKGQGAS